MVVSFKVAADQGVRQVSTFLLVYALLNSEITFEELKLGVPAPEVGACADKELAAKPRIQSV
jgi:hypothetical protein